MHTPIYSKDRNKNLEQRVNLIQKAADDIVVRSILMEDCGNDLVYFVNMFGWTYDPRMLQPHLPFTTYPFQDTHLRDMIDAIDSEEDFIFDKSRDMGASWLVVAIMVWGFLFKGWGQLYGSYKESYVDKKGDMDSHFERIAYFMERLPAWMKPADLIDKHLTISSDELGCSITGDVGENFGTGGRQKVVFCDEFSYWTHDRNAFRKTADVTNCRIFFGTPNGRFNVFGKIMTNDKDYKHLGIRKKSLHWKEHPLKDEVWYEKQKLKRTPLDMAREIDLSYDNSVEGAVYKSFQQTVQFGTYEFNPNLYTYTTWDFGRDMVAIIWKQKDFDTGAVYTIASFQKEDTDIKWFAALVNGEPTQGCVYSPEEYEFIKRSRTWRYRYAGHFGDPYNGKSRNVISTNTIKKELAKYGIHLQLKLGTTVAERIRLVELALGRQYVDSDQTEYIQAMSQSRYPKYREQGQRTTEMLLPIHDAYSHFRTAEEYWADNEPEAFKPNSDMKAAEKFNS